MNSPNKRSPPLKIVLNRDAHKTYQKKLPGHAMYHGNKDPFISLLFGYETVVPALNLEKTSAALVLNG
jgi:hypothetical protein